MCTALRIVVCNYGVPKVWWAKDEVILAAQQMAGVGSIKKLWLVLEKDPSWIHAGENCARGGR